MLYRLCSDSQLQQVQDAEVVRKEIFYLQISACSSLREQGDPPIQRSGIGWYLVLSPKCERGL